MTTEDARKLFVAGLPESMTEDVLRQLFEATGSQVVELSLPRDRATGRPRGFGFVTLQTREQADEARAVLDGSVQAGRSISVRPFQAGPARKEPRADNQPSSPIEDRTLYVGNLPYDATSDEVQALLEHHGVTPVLRVHLPVGPDGRPRGFGFVALSSPEAVAQAVPQLQSAELRGRRVMVKVAHPRGTGPVGAAAGSVGRGYGGHSGSGQSGGGYAGAGPSAGGFPGGGQAERGYSGGVRGGRVDSRSSDVPSVRPYREPEPSTVDFEDEEGAGARGAGKAKTAVAARGKAAKAAPQKRKGGGGSEDRRSRGGGASWQRWEDWDDD